MPQSDLPADPALPAGATQTTSLTAADLKNIINAAQDGAADPMLAVAQILQNIGTNVAVSGDVLRSALAEAGITLTGVLASLVAALQSISKFGNAITISNAQQLQAEVRGTPLRLQPTVSFIVSMDGAVPMITDIQGVAAHRFIWLDIQQLQLNQQQKTLRVVTSAGARDFPLPQTFA